MEPLPEMPAPPVEEHCYRHPGVPTAVHCTRCGRPICPECMVPAPVGHQCPTCVAEARKEFRQGYGKRIAVANAKGVSATTVLVAVIVAMYVVEVAAVGAQFIFDGPSVQKLYDLGGAEGIAIASGQTWRLFTAIFLHAGLLHLAFNCYALWIFGQVIEQELGRARFLLIFFVTGVFASATSYLFGQPGVVGVGASGAIFGIFGAFVAYNWRRRSTALGAARLRSAIVILLINFVLNIGLAGAIDWHAHVGGFVAGLVAGYAAEGIAGMRDERLSFALGCAALLAGTVAMTVIRTAQLKAQFPGL